MNARKRQASDTLLPVRAAKVARTRRTHYSGGNATPSQDMTTLSARWAQLFGMVADLVYDSIKTITFGVTQPESTQPTPTPSPPPPSPPPGRNSPPPPHDPPPPARQIRVRPHAIPPLLPSAPSQFSISQKREIPVVQTGLPSPPTTHSTFSSRTSSASFIGSNLQLDAALEESERTRSRNVMMKKHRERPHIYANKHRAEVIAQVEKDKEELQKELYQIKRASGYGSDFGTFQEFLKYQEKLESETKDALAPSQSLSDLRSRAEAHKLTQNRRYSAGDAFLRRALDKARETLRSPRPPRPFSENLENLRISQQAKDEEIERRLRPKHPPLPDRLPPEDEADVDQLLRKRGATWKCKREQVSDQDLSRLRPCQWLNDEIINFYGQMIQSRSEESKENPGGNFDAKGRKKPLKVHYFSTFFWTKLKSTGYEKGRLAKWTKTFDLFDKDVILIPVNHNNSHWTCAAINFRKKRIESYDSMNMDRSSVYKILREYVDAEHLNKKKKPFDFRGWEDRVLEDTPQQENGYDCGVFTCQFLEALSRGEETFPFTQKDMPYLRRRMVWEICHGRLREDM